MHFQLKARWVVEVLLNGHCDPTYTIIDLANKMPLKHHDCQYHVHCFLAMKKNKPCCNQQHNVLVLFDGTASRCCNLPPSYLMPLNFLEQIFEDLALHRIPLLLYLIPHHAPSRHEVRYCLLVVFYGSGVALVQQIISTGLRSAVSLDCQVLIDVNIGDCCKPFWGECPGHIVLRVANEQHQGAQAFNLLIFWDYIK